MKKLLLLICILSFTTLSYAQNSTDEITTKFFKIYEQSTDKAFDYIVGTNKWMLGKKDGIEKLKFNLREFTNVTGDYIGFEKLTEKALGESLKIVVFMVKYDRQPLRFIIKYYKAKDTWMLYDIKFDVNLDADFLKVITSDYLKGN